MERFDRISWLTFALGLILLSTAQKVYGALTALVIGLYGLVVGYLGSRFRAENNLLISLFATGLVAGVFPPLRHRLQLGAKRLMYGRRDEPAAVPDEILSGLVKALHEGVRQVGQAGGRVENMIVTDPLPVLLAAVEVAVYRIAQEAITN